MEPAAIRVAWVRRKSVENCIAAVAERMHGAVDQVDAWEQQESSGNIERAKEGVEEKREDGRRQSGWTQRTGGLIRVIPGEARTGIVGLT